MRDIAIHFVTRRELFKTLKMDAQSIDRLFDSILPNVCLVHKIGAVKDLQRLCLKLLTWDKKDVLTCLPIGYRKSLIY